MATETIERNQYGEVIYVRQECGCIWADGQMDFCEAHEREHNQRRREDVTATGLFPHQDE